MVSDIFVPSTKTKGIQRRALIYFICGNPGLIEYYADFFANLRGLLAGTEKDTAYDIYGRNLLGFVDEDHEPFGHGCEPWDLEGQIEGMFEDVAKQRVHDDGGKPYDVVVLMGHSVGAYIAVELYHRHMKNPARAPHLRLRHGILLFPTLTHIAQSPSGRRMELLRPAAPAAHIAARLLLLPFGTGALEWIVRRILGFTGRAANVTASWLKSRDGVRQAVVLGCHEMAEICEEQWEEELWEVAEADEGDGKTPKWFLFYAKQDHWVAERVRDEFVERRREHGERGGRTRVEVDEGGRIPHAFCTREDSTWAVAKKVNEWIGEIESGMGLI